MINDIIKKIDPKKNYNLTEMRRLKVFSDIKEHRAYKNKVMEDKVGENILKAKITGSGRGLDYKIKGKNIINYLMKE